MPVDLASPCSSSGRVTLREYVEWIRWSNVLAQTLLVPLRRRKWRVEKTVHSSETSITRSSGLHLRLDGSESDLKELVISTPDATGLGVDIARVLLSFALSVVRLDNGSRSPALVASLACSLACSLARLLIRSFAT